MTKLAWFLLSLILLACLFAPLLTEYNPRQTNFDVSLASPSREHWLGTDLLGRDIYSRILYGGRQSLLTATSATLIAAGGGLVLGLTAGYKGGLTDSLISALLDALLAIPGLLVALVIVTILDEGVLSVILAVGVAGIAPFGRTTRDAVQGQKIQPYVESALSLGAGDFYLLVHHVLRNIQPLLMTFAGVTFSWSLLNSAALTFLGFVGDASAPDWGVMLAAGRQTFATSPWEALSAGVLLTLTVGAVNRITR
ncbi:MAG: ABC transporter permease [Anaerolineae bacterium]|nr:ABC transporter permease [Anaerolineae bacterium]